MKKWMKSKKKFRKCFPHFPFYLFTKKAHLKGICDPWADVLLSLLEAKLVLAESPWLAAVVKCSVL